METGEFKWRTRLEIWLKQLNSLTLNHSRADSRSVVKLKSSVRPCVKIRTFTQNTSQMPTDGSTSEVKFASGLSIFFVFVKTDEWLILRFDTWPNVWIFYWRTTRELICNISCVLWIFMRRFPVKYFLRLRIRCAFFYIMWFCCAVFIINFKHGVLFLTEQCKYVKVSKHAFQ